MSTKEVLFLVGGLALGYLAWKQFSKGGSTTIVGDEMASKVADCQAQLLEKTKLMRTSAESLEKFKSDFMAECLAS